MDEKYIEIAKRLVALWDHLDDFKLDDNSLWDDMHVLGDLVEEVKEEISNDDRV